MPIAPRPGGVAIATIGENMTLRRAAILEVGQGAIGSYVHNAVADGLGKIGVIVALEGSGDAAALTTLGGKIAQHIAAMNPLALDSSSIAGFWFRLRSIQ